MLQVGTRVWRVIWSCQLLVWCDPVVSATPHSQRQLQHHSRDTTTWLSQGSHHTQGIILLTSLPTPRKNLNSDSTSFTELRLSLMPTFSKKIWGAVLPLGIETVNARNNALVHQKCAFILKQYKQLSSHTHKRQIQSVKVIAKPCKQAHQDDSKYSQHWVLRLWVKRPICI